MSRLSAELSSATQQAMPPEFGTECLNTRFSAYPAVFGIQREAKKKVRTSVIETKKYSEITEEINHFSTL